MTKHAPVPRVALNLRIGRHGKAALARVAARHSLWTGKKVTTSDVARDAFGLLCASHEALARIAEHRSRTGKVVTTTDVAMAAIADYIVRNDPKEQRR